jgi:hypothetical protein
VNSLANGVAPNIFAYGDVCYTSLNESKCIPTMAFMLGLIVNNILQTVRGQRPSHQIPERATDM